MAKINFPKLIAIAVPCIALAVLSGMQSLSSVATRKAPAQAVALNPYNGLAQEQLAFRELREQVAEGVPIQEAARNAAVRARLGLKYDPLAPKSYALLAMAEEDPERRSAILEEAIKLNRRDNALLGVVLEDHIGNEDVRSVVTTWDLLLRVHPNYSEGSFPELVSVLKREGAPPFFSDILTGDAPWHEAFLRFAVRDDEALPNLAQIRSNITIEDERFDRQLITGLARIGDMELSLIHI